MVKYSANDNLEIHGSKINISSLYTSYVKRTNNLSTLSALTTPLPNGVKAFGANEDS